MKRLNLRSFKMDMMLALSGIPNMPADNIKFHLTGSGAMSVARKAMPDISKLDLASQAKDQKAIFNLIADAIPYVWAALQFALEIPAEIRNLSDNPKLPDIIHLNLGLVNGGVYASRQEAC